MEHKNVLPPGQKAVDHLPVLQYSAIPDVDISKWRLKIMGLVGRPKELRLDEIKSLRPCEITAPFHCVTGWSNMSVRWKGVRFLDVLDLCLPKDEARYAYFTCLDGYSTNLPLEVLKDPEVVLAYELNGRELPLEHGWPLRLVVPKRYAYKSAKWLSGVEFLARDKKGYWELRGYSNSADPFKEERYS